MMQSRFTDEVSEAGGEGIALPRGNSWLPGQQTGSSLWAQTASATSSLCPPCPALGPGRGQALDTYFLNG